MWLRGTQSDIGATPAGAAVRGAHRPCPDTLGGAGIEG